VGGIRLSAIQHDIVWNDRSANFRRLAPQVAAAAAGGARLVVLTETFSTGFAVDDPALAEPEGGPSAQFLQEMASRHGVWLCGSCPEIPADAAQGAESGSAESGDRRPANSLVFAGPDGTVHRYHKIHPFTFAGEHTHFRAGSELVQIEIEGVRISPFVCYDLRFADEFWALAPTTDLYIVPANWPEPRRLHWMTLLQARAIENQAYVVGCNRVGEGGGLRYVGDSRIVDPLGELLATGSQHETILTADIDPAVVADVRDRFRFLPDRR
jgi:predicted amidohydrolase